MSKPVSVPRDNGDNVCPAEWLRIKAQETKESNALSIDIIKENQALAQTFWRVSADQTPSHTLLNSDEIPLLP